MFEIVNSITDTYYEGDFVAVGTYVDDKSVPYHSVIVIKFEDELYQFHYDSKKLLLDNIYDGSCFHIVTKVVDQGLVPSFLAMCNRVKEKANPKYGYFYSGEFYDKKGVHFSEITTDQFMTCVGLCLNVLKGFVGKDYVSYKDWNSPRNLPENYLQRFCEKNGIEIDDIIDSHRRITPLEFLCTGYYSNVPITKKSIDLRKSEAEEILLGYNSN